MGLKIRAADFRGSRSFAWVFAGFMALAMVCGCGPGGPSSSTEGLEDLQLVTGSVSFEGKPTPGAIVLFFPFEDRTAKGIRISGEVDEDGLFEMFTGVPQGALPGVKPGKYFVTVTWTKPVDPNDKDSDLIDLIPAKYGDALTSPLRAEVMEGDTELQPFVLDKSEQNISDKSEQNIPD